MSATEFQSAEFPVVSRGCDDHERQVSHQGEPNRCPRCCAAAILEHPTARHGVLGAVARLRLAEHVTCTCEVEAAR